jgi:hypothetical protein
MEIICDKCGSIGIWFPKDMAEQEAKLHVEGGLSGRKEKKAHPGHVVKIVPDKQSPIFKI